MVAVQIYDEYWKFSVEHLPGIDLHLPMTGRDVHRWSIQALCSHLLNYISLNIHQYMFILFQIM